MNIQDKMQEIHHKFGVTEKANYEIQLFVDDLIKKDRAEQLILHGVINCPDELEPVLAKIEHINSLGKSNWYEVVYYDGNWRSYNGSNTFDDSEKVVKWKYCKGCL